MLKTQWKWARDIRHSTRSTWILCCRKYLRLNAQMWGDYYSRYALECGHHNCTAKNKWINRYYDCSNLIHIPWLGLNSSPDRITDVTCAVYFSKLTIINVTHLIFNMNRYTNIIELRDWIIENSLRRRNKTHATEKRSAVLVPNTHNFLGETSLIQNSWYDAGNLPWIIFIRGGGVKRYNEETKRYEKWTIMWWNCEMPWQ